MTKKTLLKKLIAHYTKAGEAMTKENWSGVAFLMDVDTGICKAALEKFGEDIYNSDWAEYWVTCQDGLGMYWCKPPDWCNSLPEALKAIEYRVFIMTMELESGVE